MIRNINLPDSLSFSDYFKLNFYPEEILNYFGYAFEMKLLDFTKSVCDLVEINLLEKRLAKSLPYITFDNKIARREFLIAPVLMDLIDYTKSNLKVSYTLNVNNQLRGELDYFIESNIKANDDVNHQFLVIEAKDENLERGFKQLAVELVAIAYALNADQRYIGQRYIHGAVSIGKVWQFGRLDRQDKMVVQDLHLYRVPEDLKDLMAILVGILQEV